MLFLLGSLSPTDRNKSSLLGQNYILFGRRTDERNSFPLSIQVSSDSTSFWLTKLHHNKAKVQNDVTVRSTTVLGDINGDGFLDLLVGYPLLSRCLVFLGNGEDLSILVESNAKESFAISGSNYASGGYLGWASIRVGDLNNDGLDEIMISATQSNIIHIVFGRKKFPELLNIDTLSKNESIVITGGSSDFNFGVALSLVHKFTDVKNYKDIAITAQQVTGGQNVIYILYGSYSQQAIARGVKMIEIDQIVDDPMACFRIVAPIYSFAGLSLAGLGDFNGDGYDDLAIGSVPYSQGEFTEQITYIIYGRSINTQQNQLFLSELQITDGFYVVGGGFLVVPLGDVNSDGRPDLMISSFYQWRGRSKAYLISIPVNATFSPTIQPSSFPSFQSTAIFSGNNSSNSSTWIVEPTITPTPVTIPNLSAGPTRSIFALGTERPVCSYRPTRRPTVQQQRPRRTQLPTQLPTVQDSISSNIFTEVRIESPNEYIGNPNTNNLFMISSDGLVRISGNGKQFARNVYLLTCPVSSLTVIITNFRLSEDIIDVSHLKGFHYFSVQDISFLMLNHEMTMAFCDEKLKVILSKVDPSRLEETNFIFTHPEEGSSMQLNKTGLAYGFLLGAILLTIFLIFCYDRDDDIDSFEEIWKEQELIPSQSINTLAIISIASIPSLQPPLIDNPFYNPPESPRNRNTSNSCNSSMSDDYFQLLFSDLSPAISSDNSALHTISGVSASEFDEIRSICTSFSETLSISDGLDDSSVEYSLSSGRS